MKNLIKKTDTPLYFFFKLFSVGFSTTAMVGISQTHYANTNVYVATAMALPFAWYYAFNWIGYFEAKEKIKPILISGTLMMAFYTTWLPGVQEYFDQKALSALSSNLDYMELKEQHSRLNYNEEAHITVVKKIKNIENGLSSFVLGKKSWIENKTESLLNEKFEADGVTKTKIYKSDVATALNFRRNNPAIELPMNLMTPRDVAVVLYAKELKEFKEPSTLSALKREEQSLSWSHLKQEREKLSAQYLAYEREALKHSFSEKTILFFILLAGFVVEILFNALSLWRKILGRGAKEAEAVSSMLTLLNKPLLLDRLKNLKVVYESGKNSGKVEAIYATLINIVVLYKERKKENFVRYKDITNADICDFRYLDVYAERYIRTAFNLLEGQNVQDLSTEEIEEIIKNHKKL